MPRIGARKVANCKATGKPVVMQYEGKRHGDPAERNGHPHWLCLHHESTGEDEKEAREFISQIHFKQVIS